MAKLAAVPSRASTRPNEKEEAMLVVCGLGRGLELTSCDHRLDKSGSRTRASRGKELKTHSTTQARGRRTATHESLQQQDHPPVP